MNDGFYERMRLIELGAARNQAVKDCIAMCEHCAGGNAASFIKDEGYKHIESGKKETCYAAPIRAGWKRDHNGEELYISF